MTRIILQPGNSSRETLKAYCAARSLGVECVCTSQVLPGDVPVGDVPYCESVMVAQGIAVPKPDFYPSWLACWMKREFHYVPANTMIVRSFRPWFVKPAGAYKSEPARIVRALHPFPQGYYVASEVVQFTQEWRYYVADGEIVTTGWYDGDNEDEPAPQLTGIDWPSDFCGAVDFGRLDTGEIALVESHHPYACGWYGDDEELFLLWLIAGWEYLNR